MYVYCVVYSKQSIFSYLVFLIQLPVEAASFDLISYDTYWKRYTMGTALSGYSFALAMDYCFVVNVVKHVESLFHLNSVWFYMECILFLE